jgi:hypothetical protein
MPEPITTMSEVECADEARTAARGSVALLPEAYANGTEGEPLGTEGETPEPQVRRRGVQKEYIVVFFPPTVIQ